MGPTHRPLLPTIPANLSQVCANSVTELHQSTSGTVGPGHGPNGPPTPVRHAGREDRCAAWRRDTRCAGSRQRSPLGGPPGGGRGGGLAPPCSRLPSASPRPDPRSAATGARTGVFTGYGFETCNAPSTDALDAWLASPYRAVGIYIGGVNRTCANTGLTADWIGGRARRRLEPDPDLRRPAGAVHHRQQARPLHRGERAEPGPRRRRRRDRARDARSACRAGSPIYFDMEAYALKDAACTQAVQAFVTAWVDELHARGYVAGVYGSAASTARDMQALAGTPASPDDLWIANWNGNESVFGDPYVSDALWTNHQRIHQYRGGHKETWGGVTINIDSDFVDGRRGQRRGDGRAAAGRAPVEPGSVEHGRRAWRARPGPRARSTPTPTSSSTRLVPGVTLPGYGTGGYGVELQATSFTTLDARAGVRGAADAAVRAAQRPARAGLLDERHRLEARAAARRRRDRARRAHRLRARGRPRVRDPDERRPAGSRSCPTGSRRRRRRRHRRASSTASSRSRGAPRPTATAPIAGYRVTLTNAPVAELPRRVHAPARRRLPPPRAERLPRRRVRRRGQREPSVEAGRRAAVGAAAEAAEGDPGLGLAARRLGSPGARPRRAEAGCRSGYWRWAKWQALPFHLRGDRPDRRPIGCAPCPASTGSATAAELLALTGAEFEHTRPFAGLRIGTGIHLEPKTAALLLVAAARRRRRRLDREPQLDAAGDVRLPARTRADGDRRPDLPTRPSTTATSARCSRSEPRPAARQRRRPLLALPRGAVGPHCAAAPRRRPRAATGC